MIDVSKALLSLVQAAPLPVSPESDDFWMPADASVTTRSVDWVYSFTYWLSAASMVLVVGAMVYFCIKYRAKSRVANEQAQRSPDHSTVLEVTWSVIPLFFVIALFVWGFKGYVDLRTPPKDSMEIRATGQKWKWVFTYPGGMVDGVPQSPGDLRRAPQRVGILHPGTVFGVMRSADRAVGQDLAHFGFDRI